MKDNACGLRDYLKARLLAEHSKSNVLHISDWIGEDSSRFDALMEIFLADNYRLTQRSAWVLRLAGEKEPGLLQPWLEKMVAFLRTPGIHVAVKRNVLSIFEHHEIPSDLEGDLADLCFGYLDDPAEAVAVRAYSITILERICIANPDLMPELRLLLEEHLPHGTPAFKFRARKVLSKK